MELNKIEEKMMFLLEKTNLNEFDKNLSESTNINSFKYKNKEVNIIRVGYYGVQLNEGYYKSYDMEDVKRKIDEEDDNGEPFVPHGYYTVSNTGGYLIEISNSGDAARMKDPDNGKISDWYEIEQVPNEDYDPETDNEEDEYMSVIDPYPEGVNSGHYNIPLNMVMLLNR